MKDEPNIVDAEIVDDSTQQSTSNERATDQEADVKSDLKANILSAEHWLRCLFMVLFAVIASVAAYVVFVVVIIQFLFFLITGNAEERLRLFGRCLTQYIFQILSFLTYNSEQKPFPFADWPTEEAS